ncbi:RNA polymerase sigma factor [Taibaiella koreensis]|uniref:RNA polymerase sigma factor n=1 Tax=Taibaiella koreensis TaxID=1268548 RepID=UPI0013C314D1|nr:sigma-70 family RNA polymerase sigma factor [Taibaiella koreensis]
MSEPLLPHLFRQEYSKMTAVLCRHFGLQHIEIAEDIVSDTFLKAAETWPLNGIPENPPAWLYTVAKNRAKDVLKRQHLFEERIRPAIGRATADSEAEPDFEPQAIADSQLAMIFAVCNPVNAPEAQICLALQILCGFSLEEIANAFLVPRETIKKRLQRGRAALRADDFHIGPLDEHTIKARRPTVINTLYLLFNEGYHSRSNDGLIRKELCSEAIRLALLLTQNAHTDSPEANALLALCCFQASRLEARHTAEGEVVLFEDQDRQQWDQELIHKGNFFLVNACSGNTLSRYHLEAGIAYWHTTPEGTNKWRYILDLYNHLLLLAYTPAAALNRTFALAQVQGRPAALAEALKLGLEQLADYHALLGYLYTGADTELARQHYGQAIALTSTSAGRLTLQKAIDNL